MTSPLPGHRLPLDEWQVRAGIADGHVMITGIPASGKSQGLAARAARHLREAPGPRPIAFFTVRDESAAHLREIILKYPPFGGRVEHVLVSTFDQCANLIIRAGGHRVAGLGPCYSIWDEETALGVMASAPPEGLGRKPSPGEIRRALRWHWGVQQRWPEDAPAVAPSRDFWIIAEWYVLEKDRQNALDRWDLPLMAFRALGLEPSLVNALFPGGFQHILVDQAEELTPVHAAFLERLAGHSASLTLACDPNQAITPQAGVAALEYLRLSHPSFQDFPLRGCHRTSGRLARMAERFREAEDLPSVPVHHASVRGDEQPPKLVRIDGTLRDMHVQVIEDICRLHTEGIAWEDMAVLDRRGRAIQGMRTGLVHRNIPHRVLAEPGNPRPTDACAALFLITAALNPRDENALRIAGAPGYSNRSRTLSKETFHLIRKEAREKGEDLVATTRGLIADGRIHGPDEVSVRFVVGCRMTLETYLAGDARDLAALLAVILELVERAKPPGLREPEDPESAELLALCRDTPPLPGESRLAHLLRFLDRASRVLHPAGSGQGQDGVTFSSIRHAKGRRWDAVLLLDVSNDTFPGQGDLYDSKLAISRKLFHTAITRARKRLHLYCLSDTGRSGHSKPSPFLESIEDFLEEVDVPRLPLDPFGPDIFSHLRLG